MGGTPSIKLQVSSSVPQQQQRRRRVLEVVRVQHRVQGAPLPAALHHAPTMLLLALLLTCMLPSTSHPRQLVQLAAAAATVPAGPGDAADVMPAAATSAATASTVSAAAGAAAAAAAGATSSRSREEDSAEDALWADFNRVLMNGGLTHHPFGFFDYVVEEGSSTSGATTGFGAKANGAAAASAAADFSTGSLDVAATDYSAARGTRPMDSLATSGLSRLSLRSPHTADPHQPRRALEQQQQPWWWQEERQLQLQQRQQQRRWQQEELPRQLQQRQPQQLQQQQQQRRMLQDASAPPPEDSSIQSQVEAPPAPSPPLTILASSRTYRVDPMQNFKHYTEGWALSENNYWGSLAWAAVWGPALAVVWIIVGAAFVVFLLCFCTCCKDRWREMREAAGYTKKQLRVPLVFMVIALLGAAAGFGLIVAGEVMLKDDISDTLGFVEDQVDGIIRVLENATDIFRTIANITVLPIPETVVTNLNAAASKFEQEATAKQDKFSSDVDKINGLVRAMNITLFTGSCFLVVLLILGLVFALLKKVVVTNTITSIVWLIIAVTAILFSIFLLVYLFTGDTNSAVQQVVRTAPYNNRFAKFMQCTDLDRVNVTRLVARYVGYKLITAANQVLENQFPEALSRLNLSSGICNPFQGAPNYTYVEGACPPSASDLAAVIEKASAIACKDPDDVKCAALGLIPEKVAEILQQIKDLLIRIFSTIGSLIEVVRCQYVVDVAKYIASQIRDLETHSRMVWLGFLLLSLFSMAFCIAAPIYVFRAVRIMDDAELHGPAEPPLVPRDDDDVDSAYPSHSEAQPAESGYDYSKDPSDVSHHSNKQSDEGASFVAGGQQSDSYATSYSR